MNLIQSFIATANAKVTVVAHVVVAHVVVGGLERRQAVHETERETDCERGDVPGWVLITLMTAGLVTVLWKLAGVQLAALFTEAMGSVTGP